jgi:hypothetical protein
MERAGHVKRAEGKVIRPRVFSVHSLRRSPPSPPFMSRTAWRSRRSSRTITPITGDHNPEVYVRSNKANVSPAKSARTLDLGAMLQEAV